MVTIKNLIKNIPSPILEWFLILIFLIFWPLILLWASISSIYSSKLNDSTKIKIIKEALEILFLIGLFAFIYFISEVIFGNNFIDY